MIKVLGTKRIFLIAALVSVNVLLAVMLYMYVTPEKSNKERQLRGVRGQISGVQSDIERLQIEFDQLEEQQAQFDVLKKQGFFGNQGRRQAERIFEKISVESGVISAIASVQAGEVEDSDEARKAAHKILKSPIVISIEAMDDIDVFRYIYLVEEFFPGHVAVDSIALERTSEVTGTVLRSIASGSNPELVSADIRMTWRTMIPESEVIGVREGGQL